MIEYTELAYTFTHVSQCSWHH